MQGDTNMGWTYFKKPQGKSAADILRDEFRWDSQPVGERPHICATSQTGTTQGVVGLAVRYPKPPERMLQTYHADADGSVTIGVVCLYKLGVVEFGYKDMDETMGPYEPAHASFLRHLSRLRLDHSSSQWALEWRKRCDPNYSQAQAVLAL
jgi:hypothetical protein